MKLLAVRAASLVLLSIAFVAPAASAGARAERAGAARAGRTLLELHREDLGDRSDGSRWSPDELAARRAARLKELEEILRGGELARGEDFLHAARILVREGEPAERLALGHALCAAAVCLRVSYALPESAETLDRWLLGAKRPQQLCSVLAGEGSNAPPVPPFEDRLHQSLRAGFELEPLHYADERAESKGRKPKGFNSTEVQRLDTALNGAPKDRRPVDPAAALVRVRAIVGEGGLVGARDHLAAARLLARSGECGDLALAHALALLAASRDEPGAREAAAGTLDALLGACGEHEAFGSVMTAGSDEHAFDSLGPRFDAALRRAFGLSAVERRRGDGEGGGEE